MASWAGVSVSEELFVFLAIAVLISQIKKHKILEYWSTDPFIETSIFGAVFSRDRYLSLLRYLHFTDNKKVVTNDRSSKLRSIIDDLKKTFSHTMYPYQNLVIEDSLTLWNGRLNFKQYIPSKRSRFSVKFRVLYDCHTRVIFDFVVYTGSPISIVCEKTVDVPTQ